MIIIYFERKREKLHIKVYILDASFEVNCSQMLHACVGSHIDLSSLSQLSGSFTCLHSTNTNPVLDYQINF
jgi:hypothetical protein